MICFHIKSLDKAIDESKYIIHIFFNVFFNHKFQIEINFFLSKNSNDCLIWINIIVYDFLKDIKKIFLAFHLNIHKINLQNRKFFKLIF